VEVFAPRLKLHAQPGSVAASSQINGSIVETMGRPMTLGAAIEFFLDSIKAKTLPER